MHRFLCITALVFLLATPFEARGQSFPCAKASRPDEILICQNSNLSQLDEEMASLYFPLRNSLSGRERSTLEATQTRWLEERFGCGRDYQCIADLYERRIAFLRNY
jgi:uncharacterized protein